MHGDLLKWEGGKLSKQEIESYSDLDYLPLLISGSGSDSNEKFYSSSSSDNNDDHLPNLLNQHVCSSSSDDSDLYIDQESADDNYDFWGVRSIDNDTTILPMEGEDVD